MHRAAFTHETIGIMKSENKFTMETLEISPSGTFLANLKLLKNQRLSGFAQAIGPGPQAALYLLCGKSSRKQR